MTDTTAGEGDLDLYDDKVQAGISWAMRQWGEALGLTTWTQGDGSESVEGDVGAEIHTILVDAGLRDPETNDMATLAAQPSAGAQGEALWAMHIRGPDDLYPAPDYDTAVKWCDYVNYSAAPRSPDVIMAAVPTIWPYEPEGHQDGLAGSVADWTLPRNADGTEQVIKPLYATPAQPDTGDVAALREALEPFIDAMKVIRPDDHDTSKICLATVADYRRLAAAYAALSKPNAPGAVSMDAKADNMDGAWPESARDTIDGLESDLRQAVLCAYLRGAKDWAVSNYPSWREWLESHDDYAPEDGGA